jgi:Cu(I)/Ag(I) efflux system protein CusF
MKTLLKLTLAALMLGAPLAPAFAQQSAAPAASEQSDGEVTKVDKEAGKITLRHGALKNLGMAPMTMVFRAKEPAMLDQVKPGDQVKFVAEKVDGALTIVQLNNVK